MDIVNLLTDVRQNALFVRIANLIGKTIRHRSARHTVPRLEGLGAYLRSLLVLGARSVMANLGEKQDRFSRWVRNLVERRGY